MRLGWVWVASISYANDTAGTTISENTKQQQGTHIKNDSIFFIGLIGIHYIYMETSRPFILLFACQ